MKGYKLRLNFDKETHYLTDYQAQIVMEAIEGKKQVVLPWGTFKPSAVQSLIAAEVPSELLGVATPKATEMREPLFLATRIYVDGAETTALPHALEREGIPYRIDTVEVLSVKTTTNPEGGTSRAYEYGKVTRSVEVSYKGIYPVARLA